MEAVDIMKDLCFSTYCMFHSLFRLAGAASVFAISAAYAVDSIAPVATLAPANIQGPTAAGSVVEMNDLYILVGAPMASLNGGPQQGAVDIYSTSTRKFVRRLSGAFPMNGERFGSTLGIAGTTAYVGAPGRSVTWSGAGAVYAFDIPSGRRLWIADGWENDDAMGAGALAAAGDYLAVGMPDGDGPPPLVYAKAGHVRLLDRHTGTYLGIVYAPNTYTNDHCGKTLAGSGSLLAVGVPQSDYMGTDKGMVLLVDLSRPGYKTKVIEGPGSSSEFGQSLALGDAYLAVGYDSGAQIFKLWDITTPTNVGTYYSNAEWHVAISGDTVFFSNATHSGGGRVWSYDLTKNAETLVIDTPLGNPPTSRFGRGLAACQGTLVVGDGTGLPNSYVYELPPQSWAASVFGPVATTKGFAVGTTAKFSKIGSFNISGSGAVAFDALLEGNGVTSATRQGVWSTMGSTDLVVRMGDVWGNEKLGGISRVLQNGTTRGLVVASLTGSNARVILEDQGNQVVEIVREGSTINGGKQLKRLFEVVQPVQLAAPAATDRAAAAGAYRVGVAGVTPANDSAIFMTGAIATFGEVAREGNASPASGVKYAQVLPRVSRMGAFSAFSTMLASGSTDNMAVVRAVVGGSPLLVARKGDAAPGTFGGKFATFLNEAVSQNGTVVLRATLSGASSSANEGIWTTDNAGMNLRLALRKGNPAPALPPTVTISRLLQLHQFLNGDLMIQAALRGPGVSRSNDQAVWIYNPTYGFRLLAREGDLAPGTGGARYGSFQNANAGLYDLYLLSASLTNCSSGSNQALFAARALAASDLWQIQPRLQIRKGDRHLRNGNPFVRSIAFPKPTDSAGFSSSDRGSVVGAIKFAVALQYGDLTTSLMVGGPGL